jgi:dienelactone hydrolase
VPGVVLLPGSGGVTTAVLAWAAWLASEGYVALVLDSDLPRGAVTPFRIRMQDAFAATAHLRTLGFADADRMAVVGFSIGASAALEAAAESAVAPGAGPRFRTAIAFYPPCASLRTDTMIPILLLLGEKDNVTPAAGCVTVAQQLKDAGKDVSWVLYPGAHHGFDNPEAGSGVLLPWGLVKYDATAAADARHRIAIFLSRHLRRAP